jgi:hypothetical protein
LLPPGVVAVKKEKGDVVREYALDSPYDTWRVSVEAVGKKVQKSPSSWTWELESYFTDLGECLAAVPQYRDRYTAKQVTLLSDGTLEAGMPIEFALMILGPPNQIPGKISTLNAVTQEPEWRVVYRWKTPPSGPGAATALRIVGAVALGYAGVAGDVGAVQDALLVAGAAKLGEVAADEASSSLVTLEVTVEVDEIDRITKLRFSTALDAEKGEE